MRTRTMQWRRTAGRTAALLLLAAAAACGEGPTGPGNGDPQPGPKPVAAVVVSPDTVTLQAGQTRMLSAVAEAADRTPLGDRTVTWSTSDPAVAVVTRDGIVVAQGTGTAIITATSEGKQGHARVEVPPPPPPPAVAYVRVTPGEVTMTDDPSTWKLTARTYAADGSELAGRAVAWTSDDTTVVTVRDGSLVIRGSGTTQVTATSEGKSARAKVTVPVWGRDHLLRSAAGSALPAQVGTSTYVDDEGVGHTVRIVVTEGALRFSVVGQRYEQRLTLQTYEGGVLVGSSRYFDRGTYAYNWLDGTITFTSALYANLAYTAGGEPGGGLAVTQRPGGEGAAATFVFRK